MNSSAAQNTPLKFLRELELEEQWDARWRSRARKTIIYGSLLTILLHLIFFVGIAPLIRWAPHIPQRTEVVSISENQLRNLKREIEKNKQLNPLLKQEVLEQYKVKEPPKDAQFVGPFNQTVPKQMVAGAQADAPADGAKNPTKTQTSAEKETPAQPKHLTLSQLGFGRKLERPAEQTKPRKNQSATTGAAGPTGPDQAYRPRGLKVEGIEKGNQNLLNAVESNFYSFFARLNEPIVRNWYFLVRSQGRTIIRELMALKPRTGQEFTGIIELTIDRTGNFVRINVVKPSGSPMLDLVTQQSINKLGSIPNPPPELFEQSDTYTRSISYTYEWTDAPVVEAAPNFSW